MTIQTIRNFAKLFFLFFLVICISITTAGAASHPTKEITKQKTKSKTGIAGKHKVAKKPFLKLTSPNGNEKIQIGGKVTIRWEKQEVRGNIRLVLFSSNKRIGNIAGSIPASNRKLDWKAGIINGRLIPPGKQYRIKITALSNQKLTDFSKGTFTLFQKGKVAKTNNLTSGVSKKTTVQTQSSLEITSPRGGENIQIGKEVTIRWKKGDINGSIRLALFSGNKRIGNIAASIPILSRKYNWKAGFINGRPVPPGKNYRIRITTLSDQKITLFSKGTFALHNVARSRNAVRSREIIGIPYPRANDLITVDPRPRRFRWYASPGTRPPFKVTAVNASGSRIITLADGLRGTVQSNGTRHGTMRIYFRGASFANATGAYQLVMKDASGVEGRSALFRVEMPELDAPPPAPMDRQHQMNAHPGIDLELGPIHDEDVRFERASSSFDRDLFRLQINLRTRNNSENNRPLARVRCGYKLLESSVNPFLPPVNGTIDSPTPPPIPQFLSESHVVKDGIIEISPFPPLASNEWHRVPVEIFVYLDPARLVSTDRKYYMTFELQDVYREPIHDPILSNNRTRTPDFYRRAEE
ncbi:hypothetical protein DGMP_19380 [Desulfomarina profundi]|uniref:SbsA Ig-like domain-containing protein n=1 Tax=Desulfomarina profundi TaxID=2772557 RepID=A0A8D5FP87_9BACT|nr:GPI anchored serine-threonine rich family protein [Desulfomarina profundi]BCL61245.1 hypothetical protein DGMP_19380 [Desulfomarina profundi]